MRFAPISCKTNWSSRWEGQQGTAAQALCCVCSVASHGDPLHISSSWITEFPAASVAKRVLGLMRLARHPHET